VNYSNNKVAIWLKIGKNDALVIIVDKKNIFLKGFRY
jgi:hypothetical protein